MAKSVKRSRPRLIDDAGGEASGGAYFTSPKHNIEYIRTGSKVLDLALGGGWAKHRVLNVVGDRAVGKTLLCIEACANFHAQYPDGYIHYREAEEAFDIPYAQAVGLPVDHVDFGNQPTRTVEDLYEDLQTTVKRIAGRKKAVPVLSIIDSLDALSTRVELARAFGDAIPGEKAKAMSELFRRVNGEMARHDITFMVVSQLRDRIGIGYGSKHIKSGGNALNFYMSQELWLQNMGLVMKTVRGIKRPIGMRIGARVKKNKVGLAHREAEFTIRFGHGIDDLGACLDWLKKVNRLKQFGDNVLHSMKVESWRDWMRETSIKAPADYQAQMAAMHQFVEQEWWVIEREFVEQWAPKYGG